MSVGLSCGNDADAFFPNCVDNYDLKVLDAPYGYETEFIVIGAIIESLYTVFVEENSSCKWEGDAVFSEIGSSLSCIPFKFHSSMLLHL